MARSFTRAALRIRARFHADMEGSDIGVLDARVNELLDVHKAAVYREIVKAGPPDPFTQDFPISASAAGGLSYPLPADYWFATQLLFSAPGSTRRRPVAEVGGGDRAGWQPVTAAASFVLEYVPSPPIWPVPGDDGTDGINPFVDGICGLEEIIVLRTARDMLGREESRERYQDLNAEAARLMTEAKATARRSRGPRPTVDYDQFYGRYGYRLRAGNIEIYESRGLP